MAADQYQNRGLVPLSYLIPAMPDDLPPAPKLARSKSGFLSLRFSDSKVAGWSLYWCVFNDLEGLTYYRNLTARDPEGSISRAQIVQVNTMDDGKKGRRLSVFEVEFTESAV